MKKAIWQIKDIKGEKLGLLKTPHFLDILDVTLRAKQMYGDDTLIPIYVGEV